MPEETKPSFVPAPAEETLALADRVALAVGHPSSYALIQHLAGIVDKGTTYPFDARSIEVLRAIGAR